MRRNVHTTEVIKPPNTASLSMAGTKTRERWKTRKKRRTAKKEKDGGGGVV